MTTKLLILFRKLYISQYFIIFYNEASIPYGDVRHMLLFGFVPRDIGGIHNEPLNGLARRECKVQASFERSSSRNLQLRTELLTGAER